MRNKKKWYKKSRFVYVFNRHLKLKQVCIYTLLQIFKQEKLHFFSYVES